MSMNMLPMRFEREIGPSKRIARLHEFVSSMVASRRARYVTAVAVSLCFVLLYFVTIGSSYYPEPPPALAQPVEETTYEPFPRQRTERVKSAFVRAYTTYENHAFPHDELLPLSNGYQDKYVAVWTACLFDTDISYSFNGWGVSLVDSLDTMLLMGLNDIADRAVTHIANLTFDEV